MTAISIILIVIAGIILFSILKSFFKAAVFVILIILVYYGLMYFLDGSSFNSIHSRIQILF
jgi:uncharacterized membrane protein